jgi:hypothetical protein
VDASALPRLPAPDGLGVFELKVADQRIDDPCHRVGAAPSRRKRAQAIA